MNAEAVQAVMEVMGCVREVDDNGRAYCPVHMFGWLSDVNACPRAERVAEVAVTAARPAIEREAQTERDALAARLAAVEAVMGEDWINLANSTDRFLAASFGLVVTVDDLRAALATGTTTNQQEADQ